MEWKDVATTVAKSAPMLGGLLGGPIGAAVGAVGSMIASALGVSNTPDAVSQALTTNPDAAVKLADIERQRQVDLQQLVVQAANNQLQAETAQLVSVNTTMQAETRSEHWASWLWRPFMGFIAGIMIFGCYFVLPLAHIAAPTIPSEVWYFLGAVLGVASWFRGKAQADPANPAPVHG